MKFDNADDLPAVYKVLPDGSESLVNTHVEKDTLIVHEVAKNLRLRLGQSVLDLANGNPQPTTFNHKATSEDGLIRGEK